MTVALLSLISIFFAGVVVNQEEIVPKEGYLWPAKERSYWPTEGWKTAPADEHGIDPQKMNSADKMAQSDPSFRSLLVVKDGYIVFEKYYHGGEVDQSAEVWSVTKSFTSALVGIAIDKGHIESINKKMTDYLPDYPEFSAMTIEDVMAHRTGLSWDEGSLEGWIKAEDWIAEVLGRGYVAKPGEAFLYSSGNSHFLSALIKETTGKTPGKFAEEHLFKPLGIKFQRSNRQGLYNSWQEMHVPVPGTWRQDNRGVEIGAFGLHITAREMAKFGFLYLNKGTWNGRTIVSEKWVEASTRDYSLRSENIGFGYHWVIARRAGQITFDADGWGGQMICVIPALDMIVVTKCDAVNPEGRSSYRVLELAIRAAGK